jgi:uncharacterized C2H2 Zn-finger protein
MDIEYSCPGCTSTFKKLDDLMAHRRSYHGWMPPEDRPSYTVSVKVNRVTQLEAEVAALRRAVQELQRRLSEHLDSL